MNSFTPNEGVDKEFSVKEEEYTIWALMALLCLGLEIVLRHTLLKNIP